MWWTATFNFFREETYFIKQISIALRDFIITNVTNAENLQQDVRDSDAAAQGAPPWNSSSAVIQSESLQER